MEKHERMLVGALREQLGMRGAEAFVRRYGFEAVNAALVDYYDVREGAEVRNPAGFIVWLVREACSE